MSRVSGGLAIASVVSGDVATTRVASRWARATRMTTRARAWTSSSIGTRRARAVDDAARCERRRVEARGVDPALVDALGVRVETWERVEGGLFGASLLPYLAFLYFLGKPESRCPEGALFGFKFLLAFVFGTIPFAIYAKVSRDEILANVDVLHGCAESLLTLTNVFIVLGFREGLRRAGGGGSEGGGRKTSLGDVGAALLCVVVASSVALGAADANAANEANEARLIATAAWDSVWPHVEPANALSLPTWVIHVSSLVEWLIAMGLIWEYSEVIKRPAWKGLTWGMVPCHASGIAACTFHLFYNAQPALSGVVAMQAFLTVVGNSTCALAAYRIAKEGERLVASGEAAPDDASDDVIEISIGTESMKGWEDLSAAWSADSDAVLLLKLALVSVAASTAVKYGSLLVDFPFEPSLCLAFAIIFIPTGLNCAKWKELSDKSAK